jgi:hypothetical protein
VSRSPAGVVACLDIRGIGEDAATTRLDVLLTSPPDDLAGLLVVDTVEELTSHDLFFEKIATSRQIEEMLVVAVGGLGARAELAVPATLHHDSGPPIVWVGDPVGSTWRLGARTASRLTRPAPEKALARLLGVLQVPEVFLAVVDLPGSMVTSPGLCLLDDGDDEDVFLRALGRALNRFQHGHEEAGRAQLRVRQVLDALQPVVAPPNALPEFVPGGLLERMSSTVRDHLACLTAEVERLSRPFSIVTGGSKLRGVGGASGAVADALSSCRDMCIELREGVQMPGGGVQAAVINQRCEQFGLRLRSNDQPASSGRIVGAHVVSWVAEGSSLPDIDARLYQLERDLGPGTSGRYRQQVLEACPDPLLARLRAPLPFLPVPSVLVLTGLFVGFLAGFAGGESVLASLAAVLVIGAAWGALLFAWPASGGARISRPLLAVALLVAGGVLGHLVGATSNPPAWIAFLSGLVAVVVAFLSVVTTWQGTCAGWAARLGVEAAEAAETRLRTCVGDLVVTEWAAIEPRIEAVDTVILARSMTAGLRLAMAPVAEALERRTRGSRSAEPRGGPWGTVVDERLRAVAVAVLDPLWERLVEHRPVVLQHQVHDEMSRVLGAWVDGGSDSLVRMPPSVRSTGSAPRLPAEAVENIVSAVGTDVADSMWQLARPDDLSLLTSRAQDVGVVRFVPAVVERAVAGRWRHPVTVIAGSAAAGVLRLVPLREGIVASRWPVSVDLRLANEEPTLRRSDR